MQNEKLMNLLRLLSLQMDDRRRIPPPPPPPPPPPQPMDGECPPEPVLRHFPGHRGGSRILMLLADGDGSTQAELAEMMDIRPQSLSELLGKLEDDGLIERRSDSDDRRAQRVFLTESGRVAADGVKDRHENHTEEFLAPLSEEECETLSALIEKLLTADRTKLE